MASKVVLSESPRPYWCILAQKALCVAMRYSALPHLS